MRRVMREQGVWERSLTPLDRTQMGLKSMACCFERDGSKSKLQ